MMGSEGKLYDTEDSEVLPHIQSFIETYNLPLNELLVTDLKQYTVGILFSLVISIYVGLIV